MKPHDMGVLFDEVADKDSGTSVHLDRPFDIAPDGGTCWSLPELATLVADTAARLVAAGADRGGRVAVVKDNHWDYDLLACAAVRIGAVPAKLSGQLSPKTLHTLLSRLEPTLLITTPALLARCRRAGIDPAALAKSCVVVTDELGAATSEQPSAPGALALSAVAADAHAAPRRRHDDEPLVITHTSGTTGVPKLVTHSTRTIIRKLARFEAVRYPWIGTRRQDILANASSFAHGRTFCWTGVAVSQMPRKLLILTDVRPEAADPLLRVHPPTVVEAVPAAYVRLQPLTERLDNCFRRVRLYISTYDAMHPPTLRSYLTASGHKAPLWMQGWGQTETGPLTFRFHTRGSVTGASAGPTARDLGRPIPLKTRIRAVDPVSLKPLARGRAGLLQVKTAALGLGYVGEDERWASKEHDGWWTTGDIGVLRRDGSVRLLDREVDSLPRISCLETEDVLEGRLAQVLECVLLGRPGEVPLPVVVTADGRLDRALWQRAVADLPELADPAVLSWEDVPRTGTGKVRRLELLHQLTGSNRTHGTGRWT